MNSPIRIALFVLLGTLASCAMQKERSDDLRGDPVEKVPESLLSAEDGSELGIRSFGGNEYMDVIVVDVGQGLCVVAAAPNGDGGRSHLLYDGGGERGSDVCAESVAALLKLNGASHIDVVIISHFDSDHILNLKQIFDRFSIGLVIHTGVDRSGKILDRVVQSILTMADTGVPVIDAASSGPLAGIEIPLGVARIILLSGWSDPGALPDLSNPSERNNGVSIAARLEFGAHAMLLAGDSVGRPGDQDVCGGGEAFMVRNADRVPLKSDVLVASHHGADDGSANCFIEEVSPRYVIFPAGDNATYEHPRRSAALRLHGVGGVPWDQMFQTDFGTGENEDRENGESWMRGDAPGSDVVGDDHVRVRMCRSTNCELDVGFIRIDS